jgi:uncharacterized protein DUF3568
LHRTSSVGYLRPTLVVLAAALVAGCTGIELGAVGLAVLSSGAGNAVRAGTEYTVGGTAYRTFTLSLEDLAAVTRQTLARMELPIVEASADGARLTLRAEGIDRTVRVTFTPISPALTRLGVTARQYVLRRDKATASEIVTQIERSLAATQSAGG